MKKDVVGAFERQPWADRPAPYSSSSYPPESQVPTRATPR